jgi:sensor c-di-GMP phosphodiesterase-like protein
MSTPRKGLPAAAVAASLACLLCVAMSASALAATAIHFQRESLPALEKQLHAHEVHALVLHPRPSPGHIHASLNNGSHMTIAYAPSEQEHVVALAQAQGTPVTIATKSTTTKKTVHHKLRYIAGGILVAVIVVVAAVLLIDRRRKLNETADRGGGGTPAPSSPGDTS